MSKSAPHHIFEKFWSDREAAIQELKASIQQNEGIGGEKQYNLGKLYLKSYLEEGQAKGDTSYAMLANQYFQAAKEKGKTDIKDKYLQPLRDIAKGHYDKAFQIYTEKSDPKYLDLSLAYVKKALVFGDLPNGAIEYLLGQIYLGRGKPDLAYENFLKASKLGQKMSKNDEEFMTQYLTSPTMINRKKAKELYDKSKILFYEKNNRAAAFEAMNESIRLDEGSGGDKAYNLAKMYFDSFLVEGTPNDNISYASLAYKWFLNAEANGRPVDQEKFIAPLRKLAQDLFQKAKEMYYQKEETHFNEAEIYLLKALELGGIANGQVEYLLSNIYRSREKNDEAYQYLQKAIAFGQEMTLYDKKFVDWWELGQEVKFPTTYIQSNSDHHKALQFYEKSKKLTIEQNYRGAIMALIESINFDQVPAADKYFILGKLHLAIHLSEDKGTDRLAHAVAANELFQIAALKGKKNFSKKNLNILQELAQAQYDSGMEIFTEKKTPYYLEESLEYFDKSINLGGVPGGKAEFAYHSVLKGLGRLEEAKDYYKRAISLGYSNDSDPSSNSKATLLAQFESLDIK